MIKKILKIEISPLPHVASKDTIMNSTDTDDPDCAEYSQDHGINGKTQCVINTVQYWSEMHIKEYLNSCIPFILHDLKF